MLTPEVQAAFLEDAPELFLPVHGGWGRMGYTHIRLAAANRDQLTGALHTAWKLRVEKNQAGRRTAKAQAPRRPRAATRPPKAARKRTTPR
jgi:hypothetical protein